MCIPANADPIVTISGMRRDTPMLATIGIRIMDATVCETKVDTVQMKNRISRSACDASDDCNPDTRRRITVTETGCLRYYRTRMIYLW